MLYMELTPERPYGFLDTNESFFANGKSTKSQRKRKVCLPRKEAFSNDIFRLCDKDTNLDTLDHIRDRVTAINVEMSIRTVRIDDPVTGDPAEYHWKIVQKYDFSVSGIVTLAVSVQGTLMRTVTKLSAGVVIGCIVFLLSIWDAVLRIRIVFRFRKFKAQHAYLFDKELKRKQNERHEEEWLDVDITQERKTKEKGGNADERPLSPELHQSLLTVELDEVEQDGATSSDTESEDDEGEPKDTQPIAVPLSPTAPALNAVGRMRSVTFSGSAALPALAITNASIAPIEVPKKKKRVKRINKNTLGVHWILWALIADGLSATATVMNLVEILAFNETRAFILSRNVVLGTAALMSCVLFISYFRHVPKFYFLMEAMYHALPRIGLFGMNVLPLFLGYSFFGLVVFGPYAPMFATWEYTIVSLFALIGGDSPLFIFESVSNVGEREWLRVLARIYVSSFIVLLLICCLNITLAIVQDAYYHVKRRLRILDQPKEEDDSSQSSPATFTGSGSFSGSPQASLPSFLPQELDEHPASPQRRPRGASFIDIHGREIRNGARVLRKDDVQRAVDNLMYMLEAIPNDSDDEEELDRH